MNGGIIRVEDSVGRMRKFAIRTLGIASGVGGLAVVPTLLFNICGLVGLDSGCAEGPAWVSGLIVLICASLSVGAFYLSYRLFRLALSPKTQTDPRSADVS